MFLHKLFMLVLWCLFSSENISKHLSPVYVKNQILESIIDVGWYGKL